MSAGCGATASSARAKRECGCPGGALRHYGGSEGKEWHYRLLARRADESLAWLSGKRLESDPAGGFLYLPENSPAIRPGSAFTTRPG